MKKQTTVAVDDVTITVEQIEQPPKIVKGMVGGMSCEIPMGAGAVEHALVLRRGETVVRVDGFALVVLAWLLQTLDHGRYGAMPTLHGLDGRQRPPLAAVEPESGGFELAGDDGDRAERPAIDEKRPPQPPPPAKGAE